MKKLHLGILFMYLNCNTEYITSLFTLLNINVPSITNILFNNNNAYIYFIILFILY